MHLLGIVCQKQNLTSLCYKHLVQILTSSFFQCLFCLSFFQLLFDDYGGNPILPQDPVLCGDVDTVFVHSCGFLFGSVVPFRYAAYFFAKYRWLKRRRKG